MLILNVNIAVSFVNMSLQKLTKNILPRRGMNLSLLRQRLNEIVVLL